MAGNTVHNIILQAYNYTPLTTDALLIYISFDRTQIKIIYLVHPVLITLVYI